MGSDGVEELVDGGALVVGLVVEIHGEHDEEKRESGGMEDGGERERRSEREALADPVSRVPLSEE